MKNTPDRPRFAGALQIPTVLFVLVFSVSLLSLPATEVSDRDRGGKATLNKAQVRKKAPERSRRHKVRHHSPTVRAKAVYCVDLHRHKPVVSRNANEPLPVASLTKLVTALVVLDHMRLNQMVRVPANIKKVPKSVVGLRPGDRVTVRDLLHGLLICSGNDCAETLAQGFPGGRRAFIRAMNRKVRRLGTKRTVFYNPSGLDIKLHKSSTGKEEKSPVVRSNVSTAKEMAIIARAAFGNKIIRTICHKKYYVMHSSLRKRGYRVRTTNKLLRANLPLVGGKTGYTARAGHCLASAFTPGRDAFLIVVLGSPDHFHDTRLVFKKAVRKTKKARIESRRPMRSAHLALHHGN